jgi:hypothetical protein
VFSNGTKISQKDLVKFLLDLPSPLGYYTSEIEEATKLMTKSEKLRFFSEKKKEIAKNILMYNLAE